ncbi:MAG: hypothetical protein ACRBB3_00175 [Alphaproteobacteria bacterium]
MVEDMNSSNEMSESRFYMWRTLFAVAHADDVVTDQEIEFMAHILEDIDFTIEQTAILKDDISNPKDVEEMFRGMNSVDDRKEFFDFARDLVWVDGEFGEPEQGVMVNLLQKHLKDVDFDDLVGNVSLQFEDDRESLPYANVDNSPKTGNAFGSFFRKLFGKN